MSNPLSLWCCGDALNHVEENPETSLSTSVSRRHQTTSTTKKPSNSLDPLQEDYNNPETMSSPPSHRPQPLPLPSTNLQRPGLELPLVVDENFNDWEMDRYETVISNAKDLFTKTLSESTTEKPMPNNGMIWIAREVTSDTLDKIANLGRFLLPPNGNLYIRKVPDKTHSSLHGIVGSMITTFMTSNGITFDNYEIWDALKSDFEGTKAEPDLECVVLDENNLRIVVFEVELNHRSTIGSLRQAARYFLKEDVVAVVLVKVWPRDMGELFAAAAVCWEKNDDGEINCTQRHDFGTRAIHQIARNNFARDEQPNVPIGVHFQHPNLPDGVTRGPDDLMNHNRSRHVLTIPYGHIIRNGNNQGFRGNIVNDQIHNLELDLNVLARKIQRYLPRHNANADTNL